VWPALDEAVLKLADETVTYGELLLIGAETGRLRKASAGTGRAVAVLEGGILQPGRDEVRAEAAAFRQARRLQSGEDLRAWLASRSLVVADWEGHLRRSVAGRWHGDVPPAPPPRSVLDPALVVDLACAGWWRQLADEAERYWSAGLLASAGSGSSGESSELPPHARAGDNETVAGAEELATCLPLLGTLDAGWCAERLTVLRSRQQALAQAELTYGSGAAVAARIADRAVDWMRLVFDSLRLPTRTAADEALLCAKEDGMAPPEIARRAAVALEHHDLRRDEVSTTMAALLSGAAPGEALGPLEIGGGGVLVLWLQERRTPSAEDPVVRRQAASELLTEALERAAAGRARAIGPL